MFFQNPMRVLSISRFSTGFVLPPYSFPWQQSGSTVLSYVNMILASLRHYIPKSIVYCQVREVKRSLLNFFFTELGKKESKQLAKLLDEDPAVIQRHTSLAKRLELYSSAKAEIEAVAWAK
ncbi:hypothetical protein SLE2022_181570 [Rubroshorea leprosula]